MGLDQYSCGTWPHFHVSHEPSVWGQTVVVRTEWRISGRWLLKDQTEHICEGARRGPATILRRGRIRSWLCVKMRNDCSWATWMHYCCPPLSEKFQSFCIVILPISWAHHGIKCWVLFDMFQAGSSKICLVWRHVLRMLHHSSAARNLTWPGKAFMKRGRPVACRAWCACASGCAGRSLARWGPTLPQKRSRVGMQKKPTTPCCVFGADMSKNLMMGCCFCCSFVRRTTLEKCLRLFLWSFLIWKRQKPSSPKGSATTIQCCLPPRMVFSRTASLCRNCFCSDAAKSKCPRL